MSVTSQSNRHISTSTVPRRLRESGLHGQISAKKPLLKDTNNKKRLACAKKDEQWVVDRWKSVLWSDESKFEIFSSNHRVFVRKRVGERMICEAWRRRCDVWEMADVYYISKNPILVLVPKKTKHYNLNLKRYRIADASLTLIILHYIICKNYSTNYKIIKTIWPFGHHYQFLHTSMGYLSLCSSLASSNFFVVVNSVFQPVLCHWTHVLIFPSAVPCVSN